MIVTPDSPECQNVIKRRSTIIDCMQREYPHLRLCDYNEIGYRLAKQRPEEIISSGGFIPTEEKIRISTAIESPNNSGLVDFTLIPEVATIFTQLSPSKGLGEFIYATNVDRGYKMKGPWRQIATPALPLPEFIVARRIINNDGHHVTLDAPEFYGKVPAHFANDQTFLKFLGCQSLAIPQDIGLGDEHAQPYYSIIDNSASKRHFP